MTMGEVRDEFVFLDKHFNRAWVGSDHIYLDNTSTRKERRFRYRGYLKCKLVHGATYSLVVPDLIFLDTEPLTWFQPLHFLPNYLEKRDDGVYCGLTVDISCGQTIVIVIKNRALIHQYPDGSELYKCYIEGPELLHEYCTGLAKIDEHGLPIIRLFHHTSMNNLVKIQESKHLSGSKWNIQGTKELVDIEYVYLTCLPRLDCDGCLKAVAMSSDGRICIRRDPPPPESILLEKLEVDQSDMPVLELQVYRESTANRTSTVDVWVDPGVLSPDHLIRHYNGQMQIWYEMISAFIYRIGIEPGSLVSYDPVLMKSTGSRIICGDYVVIGDGWILEGLAAPFDEENTKQILKVEDIPDCTNILDFWFDNANSHRFQELKPQRIKFRKDQ